MTCGTSKTGLDGVIEVMLCADKTAKEHTERIARRFIGSDDVDTFRKIYQYLRHSINYVSDVSITPKDQFVKSPTRLMKDGYGDCKSYSIFAASILKNLGYKYKYRFIVQAGSDGITSAHVYVVAKTSDGRSIVIDGVHPVFNKEENYIYKKDFDMNVHYVAGFRKSQTVRRYGSNNYVGFIADTSSNFNAPDVQTNSERSKSQVSVMDQENTGNSVFKINTTTLIIATLILFVMLKK